MVVVVHSGIKTTALMFFLFFGCFSFSSNVHSGNVESYEYNLSSPGPEEVELLLLLLLLLLVFIAFSVLAAPV